MDSREQSVDSNSSPSEWATAREYSELFLQVETSFSHEPDCVINLCGAVNGCIGSMSEVDEIYSVFFRVQGPLLYACERTRLLMNQAKLSLDVPSGRRTRLKVQCSEYLTQSPLEQS